jgi:hypothetical protein
MAGGKYDLLGEFLSRQVANIIIFKFDEIEKIIGSSLPPSVTRPEVGWWADTKNNRTQSYAWVNAGFKVGSVDYIKKIVTFTR